MKKKFTFILAIFFALFVNVVAKANNTYTIIYKKDTVIGKLKRTEIKVQVGDNPLNAFKIHRVVRVGKCMANKGAIILLPASSSTFRQYEYDENGIYAHSFAGFFASRGYDVFGYSPRTEAFNFGECSSGLVDCSIMKEWGFQTTLNDLEYLKEYVKKFHKNQKPVLGGFSLGAEHTIASINFHPNDYAGAIIWEGALYSEDTEVRTGNELVTMYIDSLMNNGIYFESEMEGLMYLFELAITDPDGLSPLPSLPPGTTNWEAFVLTVTTPRPVPPSNVPNNTYLIKKPGVIDFQYASFERLAALSQSLLPYESFQQLKDESTSLAGDRTYTNNLHKFKGPVYVIGAGHSYGKYMKDNIDLFGSHRITWNYNRQFGHLDRYLSPYHRQILEYPLLSWLNGVFSHSKQKSTMENEEQGTLITGINDPVLYPNPATDAIFVNYELPENGKVNLFITDITGRKIMNLIDNEDQVAGKYELPFNLSQLNTGVYFYVLEINDHTKSGKFTIVK